MGFKILLCCAMALPANNDLFNDQHLSLNFGLIGFSCNCKVHFERRILFMNFFTYFYKRSNTTTLHHQSKEHHVPLRKEQMPLSMQALMLVYALNGRVHCRV